MLLRMAWRNIWRNKRRTLINLAALALGVMGIVGIQSYRAATFAAIIETITTSLVGHAQVHGNGYQKDPSVGRVVADPVAVEAALARAVPGAQAVRRVVGFGLAGTDNGSTGVMILGMQPERERKTTHLLTIAAGRDLGDAAAHEVVLGSDLADQLDVKPGDDLVLVGQAADGSMANDRYTIVGTADAGTGEMNANSVFLHLRDAQDFFGLGEGVHQVLVHLPPEATDDQDLIGPLATIRDALDLHSLEALSWSEIMPEFKAMVEAKKKGSSSIDVIVLLIVALGIFNTASMSVFERTREFGTMMSVGTRPGRIVNLVVVESLLQGLMGFAAGTLLALGLVLALGDIHMAALSSQDMMGVRFPPVIHMQIMGEALRDAAITAFLTVVVGGLWPALRASKLRPVEALRYV